VPLVDPMGHAYPAKQSPEQVATVKPAVAPNLPAGQLVHEDAFPVLYWPGMHR
jgi:hypothetical protein